MARRPTEEMIQSYYDGELGFLARRRVERALERSAEVREEFDGLALVGELVRESQTAGPQPDLWAEIARELPARTTSLETTSGGLFEGLSWLFRPAGAAVAMAAAAAAIFVLSGSEPAAVADVVQYLDPGDNSVMLLQGEDDATIIWVMKPVATETSSRETRAII